MVLDIIKQIAGIKDKMAILDRIRKGHSRKSVCKDITESTFRGWIKDKERIWRGIGNIEEPEPSRKCARGALDPKLEIAMVTWFTQTRFENTPLSGKNIQDQALKFQKMLPPTDCSFTASSGLV